MSASDHLRATIPENVCGKPNPISKTKCDRIGGHMGSHIHFSTSGTESWGGMGGQYRQCPHGHHHPPHSHSCDGCWCEGERDRREYGWPHDTTPGKDTVPE